jgi:hypothetical protein
MSASGTYSPLTAIWSAITTSAEVRVPSPLRSPFCAVYTALLRDQAEGGGCVRCVCRPCCAGMRLPGRWGDPGCWRAQALRLRMAAGEPIKIEKRFS